MALAGVTGGSPLSAQGSPPDEAQIESQAPERAPLGPLRVAERNPLYHLFLTPVVEGSEVLERGEWRARAAVGYSNIFELNFSTAFEQRFDVERASTTFSLARGLGGGVEIGASTGFQHDWGGFLDPIIQGVHDLFDLPNADREDVENGQFELFLASRFRPRQVFLDLRSGTAIEAPRVWIAWRLIGGDQRRSEVTVRGTVKLPFGDFGASSRGTDVAGEVAARRSWNRTHVHVSAGLVRLDAPPRLEPIMRSGAWFGSVGVERNLSSSVSVVGQFFGGSQYASGFGFRELDNLPLNLAIGFRGRAGEDWRWQVSFTEDVPPNSPAIDFTLDVALSRTWSST